MKAAAFFSILLSIAATAATSATLEVTVKDAKGAPVEDAVVWAMPAKGSATPAPRRREAAIAQKDKTFIPMVTVIQAGTPVLFPNQDPIRHHVYSFSPAKTFEIKLYAGTPVAPIVFDKPGDVVLGCNIHDHMLAYVFVVDTPFFGKTAKDGRARLEGLAAGEYELAAWHFAQADPPPAQPQRLRGEDNAAASFVFTLQPIIPRVPSK